MTPRVRRLRRAVLLVQGRCLERSLLWAESHRATPAPPPVLRQALAFAHVLDHLTIKIGPDELIVGHHPKLEDEVRRRECDAYWQGQSLGDRLAVLVSEEEKRAMAEGFYTAGFMTGHMTIDNERVLAEGLLGLRTEIEGHLARLDRADPDDLAREEFWRAARITLEAAVRFASRYSRLADSLARRERDPIRRQELRRIAANCRRVPRRPARDYWEALQAYWFMQLLVALELGEGHGCFCPGRVDRIVYPFYARDLAAGRLDRPQAKELLACWWIKYNEFDPRGVPQVLIVGGQLPDGRDATNAVTELCLEICGELRLVHPALAVSRHDGTPPALWRRVGRLLGKGLGFPAIFNDEVIVPGLKRAGVPFEEAVNYVPCSCVEITVAGRSNTWVASGYLNFARCLHSAVMQADADMDFESLVRRFEAEVSRVVRFNAATVNTAERVMAQWSPFPFLSTVVRDCVARGRDITAGGARYNFTEPEGVGLANATDGLVALREVVFRNGRSLAGVRRALAGNFRGQEGIRRRLLAAPKYGNDLPEVDALALRIVNHYYAEVARCRNTRGGPYLPGFLCWVMHEVLGKMTPATPDGRGAGEVLADSIGAAQGRDTHGPTALLRSATCFDHTRALGGLVLNLKFSPDLFRRAADRDKIVQLLETYFHLGGFEVQVNVISRDLLLGAQRHPERHRNLIVRVAGYSAYFTTLTRELQDEIIARTEYGAPG